MIVYAEFVRHQGSSNRSGRPYAAPTTTAEGQLLPIRIAHADWGTAAVKRVVASAELEPVNTLLELP